MVLELAWFVLNVSVVLFIVDAILHPQTTKRQVRELIEQACQRWKASRPLRAKTPTDCMVCCGQGEASGVARPRPEPYRERKSRRGRPKTLDSEGYACLYPGCVYFLETDATRHALIGDGKRGAEHGIQQWHCQACGHTFTARRGTMLFRLKTPEQVVAIGLHLLCRGMSCRDVAEVIGVDEATVALWLERGGAHAQHLHAQYASDQRPNVLQLDELLGTVRGC
jgi:transposase-like protein